MRPSRATRDTESPSRQSSKPQRSPRPVSHSIKGDGTAFREYPDGMAFMATGMDIPSWTCGFCGLQVLKSFPTTIVVCEAGSGAS